MKKAKNKINKSPGIHQEIRHLGVMIENVNDGVKLVAEQYGDIKKDVSDIKETLGSHSKILDSHSRILDSHSKILDSHTEMIGKLAVDLAIVKEDVEFIKNSLKRKVDVEEFAALERRVALLEKRR